MNPTDGAAPTSPGGGAGLEPAIQQVAFILSMVAIWAGWPFVRSYIPPEARFAMVDLVREHWAHRHRLELRSEWLALNHYHLWFALAVLPGDVAAAIVQAFDRRSGTPFLSGPIGWLAGSVLGYVLYRNFRTDSWPLAVMMPATFACLGGVVAARLGAWPRRLTYLRGTRLRIATGSRARRLRARLTGRVTLAGVPLTAEDETMHTAVIGATGSRRGAPA